MDDDGDNDGDADENADDDDGLLPPVRLIRLALLFAGFSTLFEDSVNLPLFILLVSEDQSIFLSLWLLLLLLLLVALVECGALQFD